MYLSVLKSLLRLYNNDYGRKGVWRLGFVKSDSLWEETVLESVCLGLSAASLWLDSRGVKVFFFKSHPKTEFVCKLILIYSMRARTLCLSADGAGVDPSRPVFPIPPHL